MSAPLVSIGLPTYNGERYIREALDSLLAQDYSNLRFYISDNASTDSTSEICRRAAETDDRITYRRTQENTGAVRNFNEAFERTVGDYFMWASDDDRWHPTYVRSCVAALEADRQAVMAATGLRFIDEAGDVIDKDYQIFDNPDMSSDSITARTSALVRRGGWYQIYGVVRRDTLARTRRLQDVYGSDVVLTMELALLGPILKVPDVLFWFRQYQSRSEEERARRQGRITNQARVIRAKYTHLEESLSDAVNVADLPRRTKVRLSADIIRAAYLEDTPFSRHARHEVLQRARFAVADRDIAAFVKFGSIGGYIIARRIRRRWGRRLRPRAACRLP